MGMVLIIWDRLFGTFAKEDPSEKIKYGLTKQPEDMGPVNIVFHEWNDIGKDLSRTDIGWKEKWQYLFGPPGWSHDGSRLTSEQMRQAESGESLDYATDPHF